MHVIVFYAPIDTSEKVKEAMFKAGAGRLGNYEYCSFEVRGIGQFRPMAGSQPYLGQQNQLEQVEEVRVEMVCEDSLVTDVIVAMKEAHPYEVPAFSVIKTVGY